ncbi:uncharacterized protein LOC100574613 [Acyrthosiphon pisum]|uniref:Uncharacterized protein n=1 Tax=Acyrthosiphon pisum TaxID=7029 RepID=A0A8R2D1Y0_ACYPI|nr:uncharacterized protein LOC100574613 [Acyrthosiphon pisum]XP_016656853.1 uncharacterized protein LOC100574613 [Acyrthosiphon pisum]|eukprot:XP_016656852.1 PREDICTED: uncharacterized protein LOC100574613 [Acyrthosiphon pisum]
MDRVRKKRKTCDLIKLKHEYWANVFTGVVDILRHTEKLNNDIITIKYVADKHKSRLLIARYSKSLDTHGKFPTPILSSGLYERLISLIANNVITQTKKELESAIYFSMSIDPVPDTDESAIYIRYVDDKGIPKKRFLDIINKPGDDALQLMNILHVTLDKYNLSHSGFMGLSYNIDSNILKHRASLKSCLKKINKFAEIMPCSSDPLSLVVIKAASSCYEGGAFFTTIDELFKFFLFFQYQWDDVKFLLKDLSYNKFSSKNKACKCLNKNWSTIVYALFHISKNISFSHKIRANAYMLLQKVKRLETCFITMFWEDIIGKITELEENLLKYVSTDINFFKIFDIYESLINYLNGFRTNEKFMDYKTCAFKKSNILHFNNNFHTEKPQMRFPVDYADEADQFKIKTYFYMIDEIQAELQYRKDIYWDLTSKFDFLNNFSTITNADLYQGLENLLSIYLEYIDYHISTECDQLKNNTQNILSGTLSSIREISTFIPSNIIFFEQLAKVIKMALCLSAINCKVEHSTLSVLKNVITSLKPITSEDNYNSLLIINMNQKLLKSLDFKNVIKDFAVSQSTESL